MTNSFNMLCAIVITLGGSIATIETLSAMPAPAPATLSATPSVQDVHWRHHGWGHGHHYGWRHGHHGLHRGWHVGHHYGWGHHH